MIARSQRTRRSSTALAWGDLYRYDLEAALRALLRMPASYQVDSTLRDWLKAHVDSPTRALDTSRLIVPLALERGDLDGALALTLA